MSANQICGGLCKVRLPADVAKFVRLRKSLRGLPYTQVQFSVRLLDNEELPLSVGLCVQISCVCTTAV